MLGCNLKMSEDVKVSLPQHRAQAIEKWGSPAENKVLSGSGQLGK